MPGVGVREASTGRAGAAGSPTTARSHWPTRSSGSAPLRMAAPNSTPRRPSSTSGQSMGRRRPMAAAASASQERANPTATGAKKPTGR